MQINSSRLWPFLLGALLFSREGFAVAGAPLDTAPQSPDSSVSWLPPVAKSDSKAVAGDSVSPNAPGFGLQAQVWWEQVNTREDGSRSTDLLREVLAWQHEWNLGSRTRIGVSDKYEHIFILDADGRQKSDETSVNLLRELWISFQFGNLSRPFYIDFGRINQRSGSGSGYNPTDYFKSRSVVDATSLDPNSLRVDRLGTVMLRAQVITARGTWTVALAPKLAGQAYQSDTPAHGDFSLDLDRTNAQAAEYIRFAPKLNERVALDLVGFARAGEKPQVGANLSTLLSDTLITNIEWSGGRHTQLSSPADASVSESWSNRIATDLTWTSSSGIELTVEHIYAGDAMSRTQWKAWRNVVNAPQLLRLRTLIADRSLLQEPLVQDGWFTRAAWRDAWKIRGLNLSTFVLANAYDGSALWQLSGEYSPDAYWTFSALLGRYLGSGNSEFGGGTERSFVSFHVTRNM